MENLSNKNLEVMTWGSLRIDHWKRFLSPVSWSLLEAAQCQYSRERHGGEVMIGMYGYTGIRPYEETCDQYMWYGTRVRCSFKNLCQQKLLKLYNKLSRLLLLYVLFCCKWVHSSVMTGGRMFHHCWFGCMFVFTGIIKPRAPKPAPDAPFSPGFCRWDVSIRWAAQWRWEARRLPRISWSEMTGPHKFLSMLLVSCQLKSNKAWKLGLFH